jgi:SAM-dependent methyltransferase
MNDLRLRLTAIGHAGMSVMNPLSPATLDEGIARLALRPGARVLDLGCGKAEALCQIVERHDAHGIGVEISAHLVDEARARAARVRRGRVEIVEGDALAYGEAEPFDLVVMLGPGWPHDGLPGVLPLGRRHTAPGGLLFVADGCWRQPPTDAFLTVLGARRDELLSHVDNLDYAREAGLEVVWAAATSLADSDRYQSSYVANLDRWCAEHPRDPIVADVAAWADHVRERHLLGGREQLGFAAYLLRTPA